MARLSSTWLSIEQAGEILGVGRARAYQLARSGVIPTLRISERRLLVPAKALDELADEAIERARQVRAQRTAGDDANVAPVVLRARTPRRGGGRR